MTWICVRCPDEESEHPEEEPFAYAGPVSYCIPCARRTTVLQHAIYVCKIWYPGLKVWTDNVDIEVTEKLNVTLDVPQYYHAEEGEDELPDDNSESTEASSGSSVEGTPEALHSVPE